jgi:hypothetical protein
MTGSPLPNAGFMGRAVFYAGVLQKFTEIKKGEKE